MLPAFLSRRGLLRAVAAALPFAALARPVLAGEEWCEDDPTMLLTTPHGNILMVYITQSGQGLQHLADLELATLSYGATSSDRRDGPDELETVFHVYVAIPNDPIDGGFAAKVTVSSGPYGSGTVYASQSGSSGNTFDLVFTVALA